MEEGSSSQIYSFPKGPCPLVKITPIPAGSGHPAAGQAGLFATRDLKPGTFILLYLGEIHGPVSTSTSQLPNTPDPHATSDYDLSLDRHAGLGIDAARKGNEARFINDYRGVPGREPHEMAVPNAEFREVWDAERGERGMGVWVLGEGKGKGKGKGKGNAAAAARTRARGIRKGDEILVSYGRGFWHARRREEEDDVEG
jgi:SET domain-containing protein